MPRLLASAAVALLALAAVSGCSLLPVELRPPGSATGPSTPLTGPPDGDGDGPMATGTIVSITDGDTVRMLVEGRELRVRLIGLDTPELRDPLECFGPEATAALEALAPVGSEVGYAYDRDPQDRYERELLYLFAGDGTLINLELVEQGFAEALLVEPNDRYWPELQAAERAARDAALGLWGACPAL